MPYYMDAEKVLLQHLLKRIKETDLVPSRSLLLEEIDEKFMNLASAGMMTLADMRKAMKNSKSMKILSENTGIHETYLAVLRREIEGYFPKAFSLSEFDWLDKRELNKLQNSGFKNIAAVFEAMEAPEQRETLLHTACLDGQFVNTVFSIADLTRIQWVSPKTARMILAAGYLSSASVAGADAVELCRAIEEVNEKNGFFKGKIGLRDIKRLIKAASYVGETNHMVSCAPERETSNDQLLCSDAPRM